MKKLLLLFLLNAVAFGQPLISMNSGELSPLLKYRLDFEKRYSGLSTLENMLVKPQGVAIRRPGMMFIAQTKNNTRARLIPFEFSTDDAYAMEFGNLYTRFFRNGGVVLDGASPFEITTVYTTAQLRRLQYIQANDIMYIVHPDVPPQKLSRTTHTDWTIADVDWQRGPFRDENITATTITPSATTGTVTLTASAAIFDSEHVGSLWQISHIVDADTVEGTLSSATTSATLTIQKGRTFHWLTSGTWAGTLILQRSYDSGVTWNDRKDHIMKAGVPNISFASFEGVDDALYRLNMTSYTSGTVDYTLTALSHKVEGVVEITAFASTTSATATVDVTLGGTTATDTWAEGAWSDFRGWPQTVTFYQNRLVLAGSETLPNTFWFSQTFDYENMDEGSLDNEAIVYLAASTQQNPIVWMLERNGILAGTSGNVLRVSSGSDNSRALTAANITSEFEGGTGSTTLQAQIIGNSIIHVGRDKRTVYGLDYSLEVDGFISPNLSVLAEHISDPCFVELSVQQYPDPIIWFVRQDGVLTGLTFDTTQNVIAWHRHPTDGSTVSVAKIPGDSEDEIWLCNERTIGGSTKYHIEQMQPQDWGSDANDMFFVDSGLSYSGVEVTTLTGFDHLIGEEIQVMGDAGYVETVTVDGGGEVDLSKGVSEAHGGLAYISKLITFPIEGQQSLGLKKRLPEIVVAFHETLKCEYGYEDGTMFPINFDQSNLIFGGPDDLFTGYRRLPMEARHSEELNVFMRQSLPLPMSVTAIIPRLEIVEN